MYFYRIYPNKLITVYEYRLVTHRMQQTIHL